MRDESIPAPIPYGERREFFFSSLIPHPSSLFAMIIEDLDSETLWTYYQKGYHCLIRSGRYFRQVLRPALSHVYFQRAMPLLVEYARANHGTDDLPPGFGDQLAACPLTARDLLHLDYAISLGMAEMQGTAFKRKPNDPILRWPGPEGEAGDFIAADALLVQEIDEIEEAYEDEYIEDEDEGGIPPFDL
jgi:hypothetical protein